MAALVVLAVILVRLLSNGKAIDQPTKGGQSAVFSVATGNVLLFDDGYDGVLAVQLDRGIAARRLVDGKGRGDPLNSLIRTGNHIVVSSARGVFAVPLTRGQPRLLGESAYPVPAVESARVWLIDYSGRYLGEGELEVRVVTTAGKLVGEIEKPQAVPGIPMVGIPGGLAFESGEGLRLWTALTGRAQTFGREAGFASGASKTRIAWCEGECESTHLTGFNGDDHVVSPPDEGAHFDGRDARFSPDGTKVASIFRSGHPDTSVANILLSDTTNGKSRTIADTLGTGPFYLAWSNDSSQLFFSSHSFRKAATIVGRYKVGEKRAEVATIPVGGALSFVVLAESEVGAFFPENLGAAEDCPAPNNYPSGRKGTCGFRFEMQERK